MSLISDALKTAQRERSGQAATGPTGQPLLDGFFPYVSTSSPKRASKLARVGVIAALSVAILGTAAWFGFPSIRRSFDRTAAASAPVTLPVRMIHTPPSQPAPQVVQAADTQA